MREIELPVLPDDTPLRSTLAVMHWSKRSGVVTVSGNEVRLIRTADVLRALKEGSGGTVGDVPGTTVSKGTVAFDPIEASSVSWKHGERDRPTGDPWIVDLASPWSDTASAELGDYALLRLGVGTASLLTKSEVFAFQLEIAPKDCYCAGPRQHEYDEPHPGICDVDQAVIECYR